MSAPGAGGAEGRARPTSPATFTINGKQVGRIDFAMVMAITTLTWLRLAGSKATPPPIVRSNGPANGSGTTAKTTG